MPWQGNTEAWFHLGVMHLNGWGVPRNVMQAQYFFSMTAKTVRRAVQQKAQSLRRCSTYICFQQGTRFHWLPAHIWQHPVLNVDVGTQARQAGIESDLRLSHLVKNVM
jgi:hypothetical protein